MYLGGCQQFVGVVLPHPELGWSSDGDRQLSLLINWYYNEDDDYSLSTFLHVWSKDHVVCGLGLRDIHTSVCLSTVFRALSARFQPVGR